MRDVPLQWPKLIQYLEEDTSFIKYQIVKQEHPEIGKYKCNTDRACRGNLGESSTAFCVREWNGDLIYAKSKRLQISNSICVEATTILGGIQYCITQNLVPLRIETDSLSMVKILEGEWEVPWRNSMVVNNIKYWRQKGLVHFSHIFREGNVLADFQLTWFLILQVQLNSIDTWNYQQQEE